MGVGRLMTHEKEMYNHSRKINDIKGSYTTTVGVGRLMTHENDMYNHSRKVNDTIKGAVQPQWV